MVFVPTNWLAKRPREYPASCLNEVKWYNRRTDGFIYMVQCLCTLRDFDLWCIKENSDIGEKTKTVRKCVYFLWQSACLPTTFAYAPTETYIYWYLKGEARRVKHRKTDQTSKTSGGQRGALTHLRELHLF